MNPDNRAYCMMLLHRIYFPTVTLWVSDYRSLCFEGVDPLGSLDLGEIW